MATPPNQPFLVVVLGETASGKSALAMQLAEQFNGEIICADSRTVYGGMDIGTAKPSKADQRKIPHHLLDEVDPNQNFTAARFKSLANQVITDIASRGKLPIMVGGTGLYIDGVVFDFGFAKQQDRQSLRPNTLLIGLVIEREALRKRLTARTQQMIEDGLETEVRGLVDKYGWQANAMTAIGYREFQPYFAGLQTIEQTVAQIERNAILYAKRQRTWFKRNNSIQWVHNPREGVDLVTTFLNKKT